MENLLGRYVKVLSMHIGGNTDMFGLGDYLEIVEDDGGNCIYAKHTGVLCVRDENGDLKGSRILDNHIELMPEGFNPENNSNYEIY